MPISAEIWYQTGKYTSVQDLKVFYQKSGQGEVLFCIHGFPSSSWDFEALWSTLSKRFEVIASDLIGLGRSAKPARPLTVTLQADIIENLLLELQISEAHLLAHDLGDTVAQELLARQAANKSKVIWRSCIFLNGGIFPETHRPLFVQKLLISPLGFLVAKLMTAKSFDENMQNIFSKAHPPSKAFLRDTWQLITENRGISMIPRLIRYMRERVTYRERWVAPLVDKQVPIRLINGIEDPISGGHMADRFAEVVPEADIIRIKNSGHYPHLETPEEVLEAIAEFHDSLKD